MLDHADHRQCDCPGKTYGERADWLEEQGFRDQADWLRRWMKRAINLAFFTDISFEHQDLPIWIIRKPKEATEKSSGSL